jgi:hypothetical protein
LKSEIEKAWQDQLCKQNFILVSSRQLFMLLSFSRTITLPSLMANAEISSAMDISVHKSSLLRAGQKRKRTTTSFKKPPKKHTTIGEEVKSMSSTKIAELEEAIYKSRHNYNKIVELLMLARLHSNDPESDNLAACTSLCRIFSRLISSENLIESDKTSETETQIAEWLRSRYNEYTDHLLAVLHSDQKQSFMVFKMLTSLIKVEASMENNHRDPWQLYKELLECVLESPVRELVAELASYLKYVDVQFHTCQQLQQVYSLSSFS